MARPATRAPSLGPSVILFGVMGLIPFWAPLIVSLITSAPDRWAAGIQAIYAGLILSFLGGARFGRALDQPGRWGDIALSMIPSMMSLFILSLPTRDGAMKLILLAAGLALALAWDLRSPDLKRDYRRLRILLTALAIPPMLAQAAIIWPLAATASA